MTRSLLTPARRTRLRKLSDRHNHALPDPGGEMLLSRLLEHFEFAHPQAPTMTG